MDLKKINSNIEYGNIKRKVPMNGRLQSLGDSSGGSEHNRKSADFVKNQTGKNSKVPQLITMSNVKENEINIYNSEYNEFEQQDVFASQRRRDL